MIDRVPHNSKPPIVGDLTPVLAELAPGADRVRGECVLVVDDEPITRLRLRHTLENQGFTIIEAHDGAQAVDAVMQHDIAIVLMDISMPKVDGFRALRLIRQVFTPFELPVIMMTASEDREQVIAAFDFGANDYVGKPVDAPIMLARIRSQVLVRNAQRDLRISEERYALAARGTNDGMWDWNLVSGELYLSPRWHAMVGFADSRTQIHGREWMHLIHEEDQARVSADLEMHLCGQTEHFESELRMHDSTGEYRWMLCRGLAVRDNNGHATRIAGSLTDITEGKVADALTGLPNRTLFHDRVQRCVESLQRYPTKMFAVIYMDVDDFKLINDSLGHEAGDCFLVDIASRLNETMRSCDSVIARLGGDEFAILVENIQNADEAVKVAQRLHKSIYAPFIVAGREILTRGSMGIAIGSSENADKLSSEKLLAQADTAMFQAKKQSDVPYCVFHKEMQAEIDNRLELGAELRSAIERDELSVHYQPIVSLSRCETIGFEALARWKHPVHGDISPASFIPIAESNGLILDIGKWVLETACLQAQKWRIKYKRDLIISVNVSVRQLASQQFVDAVSQVLETTKLPPKMLKLEVTESLLMQQPEEITRLLNRLREMGITIGVDDFGTGYSSLSYLHQMPLDVLKIDRSFVNQMASSPKHLAIIRSIIALADSLSLTTIAEGVETAEQMEMLRWLGVDRVQGFLLSRAEPAPSASRHLKQTWDFAGSAEPGDDWSV